MEIEFSDIRRLEQFEHVVELMFRSRYVKADVELLSAKEENQYQD